MKSTHTIRLAGFALAGITLLGLGACNRDKTDEDAAATQTQETTPPVTVAVADVDLGRSIGTDMKISDKTDDFKPADQIYAVVHTTGSAASTPLTARWVFQDGQTVDETTQNISPNGDAYTEFHIKKDSGFPVGKYTLHILLDGREVSTKDFEVK